MNSFYDKTRPSIEPRRRLSPGRSACPISGGGGPAASDAAGVAGGGSPAAAAADAAGEDLPGGELRQGEDGTRHPLPAGAGSGGCRVGGIVRQNWTSCGD